MAGRYSILEPGNLFIVQERERVLQRVLRDNGFRALDGVRAFEAGCSTGYHLRQLVQWGARPEDQAGMDLDSEAVAYVHSRSAAMTIHCGSAEQVPEEAATFDISLALTLFSSIPEEEVSRRISRELVRITKPGGIIVVYDMRRQSPRNVAVHPVSADDIRRWFPECPLRVHTLTLAPPIARNTGRLGPVVYGLLSALPFLRTHAMYVLTRPEGTS